MRERLKEVYRDREGKNGKYFTAEGGIYTICVIKRVEDVVCAFEITGRNEGLRKNCSKSS